MRANTASLEHLSGAAYVGDSSSGSQGRGGISTLFRRRQHPLRGATSSDIRAVAGFSPGAAQRARLAHDGGDVSIGDLRSCTTSELLYSGSDLGLAGRAGSQCFAVPGKLADRRSHARHLSKDSDDASPDVAAGGEARPPAGGSGPPQEQVSFLRSPVKVSYYSSLYLRRQLWAATLRIVQYPRTLAYSIALGSMYAALHGVDGPHTEALRSVDGWVGWCLYWVVLGVLSSIGLGAGLHTFVLFLGPHIARVTLTAHECASMSFAVRGGGAFQCGGAPGPELVSFAAIMRKVIVESLCWGAGTAVGELPPYFIARAASAAGTGNSEHQRLQRRAAAGGVLALKDRALLRIYGLLRRFGFVGILVFAAIPNPLFDLAGITCGHFKVPFWTFFGATFLGKSVVKSTLQASVVITAFSKETVAVVLAFLARVSPHAHDLAERVLRQQAASFGADRPPASAADPAHGGGGGGGGDHRPADPLSLLGLVWNAGVAMMLIYFVISTLETFAQTYITDVKGWGQNQLAKGLRGTLRYLGPIDGKPGVWAGVELDEAGTGKNDGSVAGKAYFSCPPASGIFVAPSKIVPSKVETGSQRHSDIAESEALPSISSVFSLAPVDRAVLAARSPGPSGRAGRPSISPATANPAHARKASYSRIAGSAAATPVNSRRKTLVRPSLATPGGSVSDQAGGQPRTRPPPATLSRASSRARPVSTADSVASNRTSSPSLLCPALQPRALASADTGSTAASTPRPPIAPRPQVLSGAASPEPAPTATAPVARLRPAGLALRQPPEAAAGLQNGVSSSRAVSTADPADRLRLRIDMLEAENRVLRLRSEQDKAHLAASQMLAKDLGAAPPVRGSPAPLSPDDSSRQLSDMRDALERERKTDAVKIEQLEAQIAELKAAASEPGRRGDTGDGQLATATGADTDTAADDGQRNSELYLELQRMAAAHAEELDAARELQSELASRLEQSTAKVEGLQRELGAKTDEIGALSAHPEQRPAEHGRAAQQYHDLAAVREEQGPAHTLAALADAPAPGTQVEALRRELADRDAQRTPESLEKLKGDYEDSCALIVRCRLHLAQLAAAMRDEGGDVDCAETAPGDTLGGGADMAAPQIESTLFDSTQQLVAGLAERHRQAMQRADALAEAVHAKDAVVADLGRQLAEARGRPTGDPDAAAESLRERSDPALSQDIQARIDELESANARLTEERDRFAEEQIGLETYLKALESECDRLDADVELLRADNKRLEDDLSMASLQNSTVSLDIGALDSLLPGEPAAPDDGSPRDAGADAGAQREEDARRGAVLEQELRDMERRKNNEIKRLEDEVGNLENLVEDKIFGESELNDRITALTGEVGRLKRELGRMRGTGAAGSPGAARHSIDADSKGGDSGDDDCDDDDDEASYCDICDSRTHGIASCPELATKPEGIFKQDVSVDLSRPYCDNCESFGGHWTDACPHGDEIF
ncbi:hypothetical protein LPJ61_002928 [Coemansia biformis]|uniref:CAP-Gly domain-containing protein n=1 Tax=Coemansia biformis TaxID=1286918 RepID=A0A9W7YC59_9FUNG|nr:hypothetical protein LPJ61_002928 [Coemansia biformis]